jgi:YbgC/YbaW family acyl-CoA thioester hydrolase
MFSKETEIQVRYVETDAMAVVHHASYIVWFEIGRLDFMESMAIVTLISKETVFSSLFWMCRQNIKSHYDTEKKGS